MKKDLAQYVQISSEVSTAIQNKQPVVALESTLISHGMPYPENVQTAKEVEDVIRNQGAIPATIAILDGKIKVGLTAEELNSFAQNKKAVKVSRRDIACVVAKKLSGGTTVAATMIVAEMAGIAVFATGGIGGVHRGAQNSMDISADLSELAKTNVAVVSAGVKAILDIERTLEYLETQGVPVLGYQTKKFPAFYTRESGFPVDYELKTPKEAALVLKTKWDLGLKGGFIIANPIPESYSMDKKIIDKAIEEALWEAQHKKLRGKAITPFLLERVKTITGGKSLISNIELIKNNAKVAAQIAVAMISAG